MANAEKILMVLSSYETDPNKHESTRESVKKLKQVNLEPVYININMHDEQQQDELYNSTSGVLLAGGVDIDPQYYDQELHPATKLDPKRDIVEMRILQKTLIHKKPTLAFCRGEQGMAVVNGGDLYQHLPDVTTEKHGRSTDDPIQEEVTHDIRITRHTKTHEIFGDHIKNAPSRHHQAVRNPGNLIVAGVSPGGIIEIVEHPTHPFYIGLQTHPEYTNSMDVIFEAFAKEVRKYRERQDEPFAA